VNFDSVSQNDSWIKSNNKKQGSNQFHGSDKSKGSITTEMDTTKIIFFNLQEIENTYNVVVETFI